MIPDLMMTSLMGDKKIPLLLERRGILNHLKKLNPTPQLRGGSLFYRVGVLTITVGGTAPEFHRLAFRLSPQSPEGTPNKLFNLLIIINA